MATEKTVNEFIYECCDAFIKEDGQPDFIWALAGETFVLYTSKCDLFNCATTEFMPVKAKILAKMHLGNTLQEHVDLYRDWSESELRAEAKQHYEALAKRGQFVHELTKNLLVTPRTMRFVVAYEEKAMLFAIPHHLRTELLKLHLPYDDLPQNVYHLRHKA
jgi:hypothetical protein